MLASVIAMDKDREVLAEAARTLRLAARAKTLQECEDGVDKALSALNSILYPPPPPRRYCSACGGVEETDGSYLYLTDVTVLVHEGEEGEAWIRQLLCDTDFSIVQQMLIDAGFVDHRHGGTNLLEDPTCPGTIGPMEACPTPSPEEDDDPYPHPSLVQPPPERT